MNRGHLVKTLAERVDLPVSQVDAVVTHLLDLVADGLTEGQKVNIRGFGKFEPRWREPVIRKNPLTGVAISVPAKRSVGFVPSVNLKARLNHVRSEDDNRSVE